MPCAFQRADKPCAGLHFGNYPLGTLKIGGRYFKLECPNRARFVAPQIVEQENLAAGKRKFWWPERHRGMPDFVSAGGPTCQSCPAAIRQDIPEGVVMIMVHVPFSSEA